MVNGWIVDVLADLHDHATRNRLDLLAEQLEDAMLIAATEIASQSADMSRGREGDGVDSTEVHDRS